MNTQDEKWAAVKKHLTVEEVEKIAKLSSEDVVRALTSKQEEIWPENDADFANKYFNREQNQSELLEMKKTLNISDSPGFRIVYADKETDFVPSDSQFLFKYLQKSILPTVSEPNAFRLAQYSPSWKMATSSPPNIKLVIPPSADPIKKQYEKTFESNRYVPPTDLNAHLKGLNTVEQLKSSNLGFGCCYCPQTDVYLSRKFRTRKALYSHMIDQHQSKTGDKRFICPWCNATRDTANGMAVHGRTHTLEKPFICCCKKQSGQSSNHITHILLCRQVKKQLKKPELVILQKLRKNKARTPKKKKKERHLVKRKMRPPETLY